MTERPRPIVVLVCVLAFAVPSALLAGPSAGEPAPSAVAVESLHVSVEVSNHYALTRVVTVLVNGADASQEFTIHLAASDLAFITRFALELNGTLYESIVDNSSAARDAYDASVSAGQSAGLIELRDTNVLTVGLNVPARATLIAHLAYEEMIYKVHGEYEYAFPLYATAAGQPVGHLTIEGKVAGHTPIAERNISDGVFTESSSTSFAFKYGADGAVPTQNFTARWREAYLVGAGAVFAFASPDGVYFVHAFSSDGAGLATSPLPKDIVFVLDRSGSMSGLKMEQARVALNGILGQLRGDDRFTVVVFDSTVGEWSGSLRTATDAEISSAQSWVSKVSPGGSTNIDAALERGISLLTTSEGRAPTLVFLTDGHPTAGVTAPDSIRSNLVARNTVGAAVFTLAFGADADLELLRQIAAENHGIAKRIYEAQDAAVQIQGFYDTFASPAMAGVKATYRDGQDVLSVDAATAAYSGSDLVFVGRLPPGATTLGVVVTGTAASGPVRFEGEFDLAAAEAGPFVERAWAYERIRSLEREAVLDNASARAAIVNLAIEYHFVTEYTSLVVVLPAEVSQVASAGPQAPLQPSLLLPSRTSSGSPSAMSAGSVPALGGGVALVAIASGALLVARKRRRRGR